MTADMQRVQVCEGEWKRLFSHGYMFLSPCVSMDQITTFPGFSESDDPELMFSIACFSVDIHPMFVVEIVVLT